MANLVVFSLGFDVPSDYNDELHYFSSFQSMDNAKQYAEVMFNGIFAVFFVLVFILELDVPAFLVGINFVDKPRNCATGSLKQLKKYFPRAKYCEYRNYHQK